MKAAKQQINRRSSNKRPSEAVTTSVRWLARAATGAPSKPRSGQIKSAWFPENKSEPSPKRLELLNQFLGATSNSRLQAKVGPNLTGFLISIWPWPRDL